MKQAVFVDTDIILDLLARREPFYLPAARLFSLADRKEVTICISSITFANLFYILRKEMPPVKAKEVLKKFKQLVTVLPVDDRVVTQVLDAGFSDFEDALQYYTAMTKGISCLITRNVRDYRHATITICSAEEFLAGRG